MPQISQCMESSLFSIKCYGFLPLSYLPGRTFHSISIADTHQRANDIADVWRMGPICQVPRQHVAFVSPFIPMTSDRCYCRLHLTNEEIQAQGVEVAPGPHSLPGIFLIPAGSVSAASSLVSLQAAFILGTFCKPSFNGDILLLKGRQNNSCGFLAKLFFQNLGVSIFKLYPGTPEAVE